MMSFRALSQLAVLVLVFMLHATPSAAQEKPWVLDGTLGYTGLVDDATDHYLTSGGAIRDYLTHQISVGLEFVYMTGSDSLRDRAMMMTGNVVFDLYPVHSRRVTPFLVGGLGMFWVRESFPTGEFWSGDPAFTAGGGVRGSVTERVSVAAEYRLGWELHHRLTGSVTVKLK
jgi:hypothetical protein